MALNVFRDGISHLLKFGLALGIGVDFGQNWRVDVLSMKTRPNELISFRISVAENRKEVGEPFGFCIISVGVMATIT